MGWGSKTSKVGFKMPHHVYSYSVPFWRIFTFCILNSFFAIPFAGNVFSSDTITSLQLRLTYYSKWNVSIWLLLAEKKWFRIKSFSSRVTLLEFKLEQLSWKTLVKLAFKYSFGGKGPNTFKLLGNRFRPFLFPIRYWIRILE